MGYWRFRSRSFVPDRQSERRANDLAESMLGAEPNDSAEPGIRKNGRELTVGRHPDSIFQIQVRQLPITERTSVR